MTPSRGCIRRGAKGGSSVRDTLIDNPGGGRVRLAYLASHLRKGPPCAVASDASNRHPSYEPRKDNSRAKSATAQVPAVPLRRCILYSGVRWRRWLSRWLLLLVGAMVLTKSTREPSGGGGGGGGDSCFTAAATSEEEEDNDGRKEEVEDNGGGGGEDARHRGGGGSMTTTTTQWQGNPSFRTHVVQSVG